MTNNLSPRDIESLLTNPSVDARADVAAKVAQQVSQGALSAREKEIADQILRVMVNDAAERVRGALATTLAAAADVPRDIALKLAQDIDVVAMPILESSPILTDADLMALVRAGGGTKQQAIARRPTVSEQISEALVETGDSNVVRLLVRNPGALISEETFDTILDHHGEDEEITQATVLRESLPLTVAERLVAMVTDQMRSRLVSHHKVPKHIAERLAAQSRERATVSLADGASDSTNVAELVQQLRASGRLTPSLMLRSAMTGDMRFCEEALAQLGGLPVHKAWILIHDAGPLGLRAIYDRAKLPEVLYPAFRVALDVFHENTLDGQPKDQERFQRRMLERVLTQYDEIATDDLEFLLDRLGQLSDADAINPAVAFV